MTVFEDMVEAAVEGGLNESAIVDYYFLSDYPYLQNDGSCCSQAGIEGDMARYDLLRRFRQGGRFYEVAPPGWEGTVKAMKKHMTTKQAFRRAWAMHKKGARPHKGG